MYAIVETGGKQYRVKEGDRIRVELLKAEEGSTVTKVLGHGKEDKVVVFKYRRKKNYRRFRGHRQHYTDLLVEGISL